MPNENIILVVAICASVLSLVFFYLFFTTRKERNLLQGKYSKIIDVDKETEERKVALENFNQKISDTKQEYVEKRKVFESLLKEISILEENLELTTFGVYSPHFDFDTSEKFKDAINTTREKQKIIIGKKEAVVCHTQWEVSGSKREGAKMTNRYIKLMARAFNNECDACNSKVKWNNIKQMEARIEKAFSAINKLGETHSIDITREYLDLKLEELRLTHEYAEKRQEEKEEQRRIREMQREEEKVLKEVEEAKKKAEKEELQYQKALEKARLDLEKAKDDEVEALKGEISALERKFEEAHSDKERAISRAQLTKSGHVYIISNIGSFGENVYKIGMTRRLEPLDRVKELGDASVPFRFDVHAIIFSKDAPKLENELHDAFKNNRINLVNSRKEFFKVPLVEIENKVISGNSEIQFTKIAEAQEYRESLAINSKSFEDNSVKSFARDKFPDEL